MNGSEADPLVVSTAAAVRAARCVQRSSYDTVIPVLPPQRRRHAAHIMRHVERGDFLNPDVLHDIEAFLDVLRGEVAAGTHVGWEADEQHVRGGWEVFYPDDRALALARPVRELEHLHAAIMDVLDLVQATRLVATLLED